MNPMLRILGLTLATALASGALTGSASAEFEEVTQAAYFVSGVTGEETTKVDGSQIGTNTLTANGMSVTCATANQSGQALTAGEASTEIKLEPSFEKCHVVTFGITKTATITTNGCYYTLNATTTVTEGIVFDSLADFSVVCPGEKQIEVHIYEGKESEEKTLCTYDVKPQSAGSAVTVTNVENEPESPNDVVVNINATLTAINTKPSFTCGTSESISATLKGESTLKATNASGKEVDFQGTKKKRFFFGVDKDADPAFVTSSGGTVKFKAEAGEITCTVHYVGTAASREVKELSITPTYTGCKAFGFKEDADVKFEGCTYTLTLEKRVYYDTNSGKSSHTHGPWDIVCPPNKTILIEPTEAKAVVCTIKVAAQTPTTPLTDQKNEKNAGGERYVVLTSTVKGLAWEIVGGGGKCGKEGKNTAEVEGSLDLKAFKDVGGKITTDKVEFQVIGTADP